MDPKETATPQSPLLSRVSALLAECERKPLDWQPQGYGDVLAAMRDLRKSSSIEKMLDLEWCVGRTPGDSNFTMAVMLLAVRLAAREAAALRGLSALAAALDKARVALVDAESLCNGEGFQADQKIMDGALDAIDAALSAAARELGAGGEKATEAKQEAQVTPTPSAVPPAGEGA